MNEFNYELFCFCSLLLLLLSLSPSLSFSLGGLLLLGGLVYLVSTGDSSWHAENWSFDHWRRSAKGLLLLCALAVWCLVDRREKEVLLLSLFVVLASMTLVSCDHLLMVYLCLELQTFCLFVLIARGRNSMLNTEAGLKYFILGAISSGVFLLGVSLHYGNHLGFGFQDLPSEADSLFSQSGRCLILISLFFKLTVVPFHFWAPDVYEGASNDTVLLIATLPKISVLSVVVQLAWLPSLLSLAVVFSLTVGALGALNQTKVKRLIAYSGMTHVGFVLLGLLCLNNYGLQAACLYLVVYLLMVVVAFAVILANPSKKGLIVEFAGLHKENAALAFSWSVLWLSIAGIPPLAGFLSKWVVLWSAFNFEFYLLCLLAVLSSMVAGGYYLRVVKMIYFQKKSDYLIWESVLTPAPTLSLSASRLVSLGSYALLFLMLNPSPLLLFSHWSTLCLY